MRVHTILVFLILWLITSCTPPKQINYVYMNNISHVKITTIMAHAVNTEMEPIQINDKFNPNEYIYVYSTFSNWRGDSTKEEQHIFAKWYINGRFIRTSEYHSKFMSDPWNVWFYVSSNQFGTGKGRVEIYSQGTMIDHHDFEITPS